MCTPVANGMTLKALPSPLFAMFFPSHRGVSMPQREWPWSPRAGCLCPCVELDERRKGAACLRRQRRLQPAASVHALGHAVDRHVVLELDGRGTVRAHLHEIAD